MDTVQCMSSTSRAPGEPHACTHAPMQKARKPDMQLCKKMKEEHTPRHVYGHIPGVAVGDVFNGRGEVAVLGLHTQICQGIDR